MFYCWKLSFLGETVLSEPWGHGPVPPTPGSAYMERLICCKHGNYVKGEMIMFFFPGTALQNPWKLLFVSAECEITQSQSQIQFYFISHAKFCIKHTSKLAHDMTVTFHRHFTGVQFMSITNHMSCKTILYSMFSMHCVHICCPRSYHYTTIQSLPWCTP